MKTLITRFTLWVVLLVSGFVGGWLANKAESVSIHETDIKLEEKVITKTVIERVTDADGKTTETEKTTVTTDKKQQDKQSTPPTSLSSAYRPQFSLGVNWKPQFDDPDIWQPQEVQVGYRFLGNAWAIGGYDWKQNEYTLGLRIDF